MEGKPRRIGTCSSLRGKSPWDGGVWTRILPYKKEKKASEIEGDGREVGGWGGGGGGVVVLLGKQTKKRASLRKRITWRKGNSRGVAKEQEGNLEGEGNKRYLGKKKFVGLELNRVPFAGGEIYSGEGGGPDSLERLRRGGNNTPLQKK